MYQSYLQCSRGRSVVLLPLVFQTFWLRLKLLELLKASGVGHTLDNTTVSVGGNASLRCHFSSNVVYIQWTRTSNGTHHVVQVSWCLFLSRKSSSHEFIRKATTWPPLRCTKLRTWPSKMRGGTPVSVWVSQVVRSSPRIWELLMTVTWEAPLWQVSTTVRVTCSLGRYVL